MTKAELETFVAEMRDELQELKDVINGIHLNMHMMNVHLLEHVDGQLDSLYQELGVKRLAKKTFDIARANRPADAKKEGEWRKGKMWNEEELQKAKDMYASGMLCDDIGPEIGRSPLSVLGKLFAKKVLNKEDSEKWVNISKSFDK